MIIQSTPHPLSGHVTDHAGRNVASAECNPGTNFWLPPIKVTKLWHPMSGFGARFLWGQKEFIDQEARRGKSIKQKLLEMIQVTVLFHNDEFIFVWSFKNGNGRQNRSSDAKNGLLRRTGAKIYFPGDTRNVGAGMVCHVR